VVLLNQSSQRKPWAAATAVVAGIVIAVWFLLSGVVGALRSGTAPPMLVIGVGLSVSLGPIAAYMLVTSVRQLRRIDEVRSQAPTLFVVGVSAMFFASTLSDALGLSGGERLHRFGSFFVVSASGEGIVFWSGNPRNPVRRCRLPW